MFQAASLSVLLLSSCKDKSTEFLQHTNKIEDTGINTNPTDSETEEPDTFSELDTMDMIHCAGNIEIQTKEKKTVTCSHKVVSMVSQT